LVVIVKGNDMSNISDEFARYAKAERRLCDEAGPVLAAIVQALEADAGLRITEFRVTVDWGKRANGSIAANCTIVHARNASTSDGPDTVGAAASTQPPGAGLSLGQDQCLG
jgi:hypothetical protein